jgi:predicted GTPase
MSVMLVLFTRFGVFLAVLFLLPWLALIALGGYWLWQHGWFYYGAGILSANVALVIALVHWRTDRSEALIVEPIDCAPNPNWSSKAELAWQELQTFNDHRQVDTAVLSDFKKALKLTNEVLALVARHFNADSKYPILEFPLPYLLRLMVLVCEDIQHEVLDKIPASHAVRVGDLLRAKQAINTLNQFTAAFTVGTWLFNWSGAALAKAQSLLIDKGLNKVTDEIARRLISVYINKLGYYAIQLYSGQITLDDIVPTDHLTSNSRTDIAEETARQPSIEPLRILVLGQVSTGKSSLINALFGEIKTAEGLLPTTAEITPYLLERDGLQQAIILDSAGYNGLTHQQASDELKQQWQTVDVILLVCNAAQAARHEDTQQLNALRHYFQQDCQNQKLPVIIAVATHIDRLRPMRDWQPPYNIQQPDNAKAQSIQQACVAIAHDLNLPLNCIVPVCLAPEKPAYNIEDGLIPLIHEHLDDAQRVRYLRCLRHQQKQDYWQQWKKQARQVGQIIFNLS